jgi:probable HAF family extracellular repeat protein
MTKQPNFNRRQLLVLTGTSLLSTLSTGGCGGGKGGQVVSTPTPNPTPTPLFGVTFSIIEGLRDMHVEAISDDGRVLAGYRDGFEGAKWDAQNGIVNLGYLREGDNVDSIYDVSADGSVLVGESSDFATRQEAFRWTKETGMVGLGRLSANGRPDGTAWAVSGDGRVIAGYDQANNGSYRAFRWTQETGMVSLGTLPAGRQSSMAYGMSQDGRVVVGESGDEAFRWTQETGMVGLGNLYPRDTSSWARNISANGKVIVGFSKYINGADFYQEAFRWTAETGMVGLGQIRLGNNYSDATQVSGDGAVITGFSATSSDGRTTIDDAFIWTVSKGTRQLAAFMNGLGIDTEGWKLQASPLISTDGKNLVGRGFYNGNLKTYRVYSPNGFANL